MFSRHIVRPICNCINDYSEATCKSTIVVTCLFKRASSRPHKVYKLRFNWMIIPFVFERLPFKQWELIWSESYGRVPDFPKKTHLFSCIYAANLFMNYIKMAFHNFVKIELAGKVFHSRNIIIIAHLTRHAYSCDQLEKHQKGNE